MLLFVCRTRAGCVECIVAVGGWCRERRHRRGEARYVEVDAGPQRSKIVVVGGAMGLKQPHRPPLDLQIADHALQVIP